MEAIQRRLAVMDATALTLCMENELPIHVFNMDDPRNIARILAGERVGTLVSDARAVELAAARARARGIALSSRRDAGDFPAMALIDELLDDARERMHKSVEATVHELGDGAHRPREPGAARPHPRRLLRHRRRRCASSRRSRRPRPRLLTIQPFDNSAIKAIEKAINESDLGLQPVQRRQA